MDIFSEKKVQAAKKAERSAQSGERRARSELSALQFKYSEQSKDRNLLKKIAANATRSLEVKNAVDAGFGNDFQLITNGAFSALTPGAGTRPSLDDLIEQGFILNSTVQSVINKIAQTAAMIPWIAQVKVGPNKWEDAPESKLQALIDKPSNSLTKNEFRINSMVWLLLTGNYYLKHTKTNNNGKESIIGENVSLKIFHSNLIAILKTSENEIASYEYKRNNMVTEPYKVSELIHTKFLDPSLYGSNEHLGLSPLVAAWSILGASNNSVQAQAAMLKNRGVLGIISNKDSTQTMLESERREIQEATDDIVGGPENFNKPIVAKTPIEYTSIGMSPTDLKMVEGTPLNDRSICNAFGVSSILFNDVSAATLDNYTLAEKKLYTDSCVPNNDVLLRPWSKSIIPMFNKSEGKEYRIIQDLDDISVLQINQKDKAKKESLVIDNISKILALPIPDESKQVMLEMIGIKSDEVELLLKKSEEPEDGKEPEEDPEEGKIKENPIDKERNRDEEGKK